MHKETQLLYNFLYVKHKISTLRHGYDFHAVIKFYGMEINVLHVHVLDIIDNNKKAKENFKTNFLPKILLIKDKK